MLHLYFIIRIIFYVCRHIASQDLPYSKRYIFTRYVKYWLRFCGKRFRLFSYFLPLRNYHRHYSRMKNTTVSHTLTDSCHVEHKFTPTPRNKDMISHVTFSNSALNLYVQCILRHSVSIIILYNVSNVYAVFIIECKDVTQSAQM